MRGPRSVRIILLFAIVTALYLLTPGLRGQVRTAPFRGFRPRARKILLDPAARAGYVREAFIHAWSGYEKYAFPHNDLKPLSKSFVDTRCVWGTTAVDSLTTAIIMDLPEIVDSIFGHIFSLDFDKTDMKVSLFGSTIRYLGSMLSSFDLLLFEMPHLLPKRFDISLLVDQAQNLADDLSFAFHTPSHLPQNNIIFQPKPKHREIATTDISAVGTLTLEWTRLSDLTGLSKYEMLIDKAMSQIFAISTEETAQPFPGLIGRVLDLKTGRFNDAEGAWYSGGGSFYEYLIKMYVYSPVDYGHYKDWWVHAADSSMHYLASHPSTRPDLTFLASYNGTNLIYSSDHTAHFAAANFLLGGSVLGEQKYTNFGLELVRSQVEMYRSTRTGLGADSFAWLPEKCTDTEVGESTSACHIPQQYQDQADFAKSAGYYITDPINKLRPEVFESLYYAYRVTKDRKWQEMSWELFESLDRWTKVESGGYAELEDVNQRSAREGSEEGMRDLMYSYFLAETLKYAYLIHVEEGPWHVQANGKNKYVFNTEAHPIKVRGSSKAKES